jgi:hypothetical protein
MLTGRNPAELPTRNLKIDLSGLLYMSPRLSYVLNNWLDPDPDRRFLSAANAAAMLRGELSLPGATPSPQGEALSDQIEAPEYPSALPSDSTLEIQSLNPGLYVKIPRRRQGASGGFAVFPIVFLGFVFFWTTMTMRMHAPIFFPIFSIPFWVVGITMAKSLLRPTLTQTELFVTPDGLLKKSTGLFSNSAQQVRISDLGRARVRRTSVRINGRYLKELVIEAGTGTVSLGLGLSDRELSFLEKRINEELGRLKQLSHD